MGSPEHKQKIWEMISDIGIGMLVTQSDNTLQARPMQIVQDDYDGRLWFFTNVESEKVDEIIADKSVCLTFSCPKKKTYVSLTGKATLTKDMNLINKFWSPFVAAWFPEGKESNNCALLEIKINHGEHWDADITSIGYLYQVAKANLTGDTPSSSSALENEKF